jgi:putative aldouronate transport system permease protein
MDVLNLVKSVEKPVKRKKKWSISLFFMALPVIVCLVCFSYVPLHGWIYTFFEYSPGLALKKMEFVGFKYFAYVFTQPQVLTVVRNTLVLSSFDILLSWVPVVLAVLLSEVKSKRFQKLIQTTTTLPNFISWIIVYALFYAIFSSQGMLNQIIMNINPKAETINLLGNPDIAWYVMALTSQWKFAGYNSIIFLAAITAIDQEQYEAAIVDGASRLQRIIHITIPALAETYLVLLLLGIAFALSNGFEQYYVFSNPVIADRLNVLDLYVYKMGLMNASYSLATAIGIYKTFISIILLIACNIIAKKIRGSTLI